MKRVSCLARFIMERVYSDRYGCANIFISMVCVFVTVKNNLNAKEVQLFKNN